jgi:glutathione synthase
MKFLFVMDPISTVRPYKDTSYFLMLAAHSRGHEVYHADVNDLYFLQVARARATKYQINPYKEGNTYKDVFKHPKVDDISVDSMDVVWIRKDPPFDDNYLYMTRLLSLVKNTKVINSPQGLQAWNEKLAALEFQTWTPWTFVSSDAALIYKALQDKTGRFVLKPLDGFGGKGIEFIQHDEPNAKQRITSYLQTHLQKPIIVQEYLKEADKGDKRILLWKGKAIGAVLRVHAEGQELNNIDAGGKAVATSITAKEQELCNAMGSLLYSMGLWFVGIDVIGEKLTEINITSPTTLQEMSRLSGKELNVEIIKDLESL